METLEFEIFLDMEIMETELIELSFKGLYYASIILHQNTIWYFGTGPVSKYQSENDGSKGFYAWAILCFHHYCLDTLIVGAAMMEPWNCRVVPFYVSIIFFWYFDTGPVSRYQRRNDGNIAH